MKTPIFILRIGTSELLEVDRDVIGHLQEEIEDAVGCALPFGILTIVSTDKSASELRDLYMDAANKLDDNAPVIIWDPSSDSVAINLSDYPQVRSVIEAFEEHNGPILPNPINNILSHDLSLDDLIDKVGRTGRGSLTSVEFARLEKLSKAP